MNTPDNNTPMNTPENTPQNTPEPEELGAVYARDLEKESREELWLIESLWGRSAAGLLGGTPKSAKTFLGLDLALSVASGTPALGHFHVQAPGTALVYLAEDRSAQVRFRLEALARHRGLDFQKLDLVVITEPTLRLDGLRDQERLRRTVARFRPRLVVLDPLVRLHSLDENSSQEISRLLSYFRELQRTFDLALILVHHTSKKTRAQPGQTLRGSSDLHAFGDSNAYLTRKGDEEIVLTLEHRSAKPPRPMTLELVTSPDGSDAHLEVRAEAPAQPQKPALKTLILELLRERGPLARTEIRAQLRVNNQRLGDALCALEKSEEIHHLTCGWALKRR